MNQAPPPNISEVDFRPGPAPFLSFFRFFSFSQMITNWDFEDSLVSGRRPSVFRFFVFIRFYSFLQFDTIWAARQGRLPCLGHEGCRRHFAFDLHIEMIQIRPFGLKFCLRPAGTLSFFIFFVLFSFNSFLPFEAIWLPAQDQPPVGWDPFRFSFFRFISFYFVYFRLFSSFLVFRNRSDGLGGGLKY